MGGTKEEVDAAVKPIDQDNKHLHELFRSEVPQHTVILAQPLFLGVNEVTQGEYQKVTGINPSHFSSLGAGKNSVNTANTTNHPVESVS